MVRARRSVVGRENLNSKRRCKEFEEMLSANKDLIAKLSKLPLDGKGARIYSKEFIRNFLVAIDGFPIQWVSDSFDIQPCVIYRWRRRAEINVEKSRQKCKPARRYTRSEKAGIAEDCERLGTERVHDEQGVSWDTIAAIRADSRKTSSPKKRRHHELVVEIWRAHPGMGPMQVRDWMARYKGLRVGVNTVRKIMEGQGWVPPFSRVKREPKSERRFEACRRNAMWHTDFKHAFIGNSKIFILVIQDDYSRFVVGYAVVDGEKSEVVLSTLKEAISKHGRPDELMTDGGSAFHAWRGVSELTKFLEEGGIDHYVARSPNVNGKIENLNQQIDKELLLTKSYASIEEFVGAFDRWIVFYNFERIHQGLGKLETPADRFFPGSRDGFSGRSTKEALLRLLMSA